MTTPAYFEEIQKETTAPVIITYENTTEVEQKAFIFETFEANSNQVEISISGWENTKGVLDFFKRFYFESPREIKYLRMQTTAGFRESQLKRFFKFSKSPSASTVQIPFINWMEEYSTNQFKQNMIDIAKPFLIDGVSQDIFFTLAPKEKFRFIYWTEKAHKKGRSDFRKRFKAECEKNASVRVNQKEIILTNHTDSKIIEPLCEPRIMSMVAVGGYTIKTFGGLDTEQTNALSELLITRGFNNIRVVVLNSDSNTSNQLFAPIKIKNINYYPLQGFGNQTSNNVIDIPIGKIESIERALDIELTLFPRTEVAYLFQNKKDLPYFKSDAIHYNVTANEKLNCAIKKSEIIKIRFNSIEDMENEIVINDGAMVIHPLAFADENKYNITVLTFDGKDIPEINSIYCASSFEIIAGNDVMDELKSLRYPKDAFNWIPCIIHNGSEVEIYKIVLDLSSLAITAFHSFPIPNQANNILPNLPLNMAHQKNKLSMLYSRSEINGINHRLISDTQTLDLNYLNRPELSFHTKIHRLGSTLDDTTNFKYQEINFITKTNKMIVFLAPEETNN